MKFNITNITYTCYFLHNKGRINLLTYRHLCWKHLNLNKSLIFPVWSVKKSKYF